MSQFGPIIGNRLANAHKAAIKPHLLARLALASCRSTPLGAVATGTDGRMSFAPSYLLDAWVQVEAAPRPMPRSAFRPGQRVRVDATLAELLDQHIYPFELEEAKAVAGCEGVVMEDGGCAPLGLVLVMLDGMPWVFMPAYLRHMPPAEGDDELAAMADYTCPF